MKKIQRTTQPSKRLSYNDWHKYLRNQVNASKGIKKVLTVLFLCLSFAANAQNINILFPYYVEVADNALFEAQGENLKQVEYAGDGLWSIEVFSEYTFLVGTENNRYLIQFINTPPIDYPLNLTWEERDYFITWDDEVGYIIE